MAEQTKKQNGGEEVAENEISHGNLGLPFGLCKKYGIAIGKDWTPRDAWAALAGKGIYPPWTERGKDQYTTKKNSGGNQFEITESKKKVYDTIRTKLTGGFGGEYVDKLSKALENLDDNEIEIFAKTLDGVKIKSGSGMFYPLANEIETPKKGKTSLDEALGFDFSACTFFHEYGHYVAEVVGEKEGTRERHGLFSLANDFNLLPEVQQILKEDAIDLFNRALKEEGSRKTANLARIDREQRNAVYKLLAKVSDKEGARAYEPTLYQTDLSEKEIRERMDWGYSREQAIDSINRENERNKEFYAKHLAEWERVKDNIGEIRATHQRAGFLSDFIGGATGGKINPKDDGYWGHSASYFKRQKNGVETWAEYFSFKMTKDKKGLEMFKEYLPRTFAKYEEVYNGLADKI